MHVPHALAVTYPQADHSGADASHLAGRHKTWSLRTQPKSTKARRQVFVEESAQRL